MKFKMRVSTSCSCWWNVHI